MLKYIKKAYVMSIASSFEIPGEAVDTNETIKTSVDSLIDNTKDISQLIKDIQKDGEINGEDSENLKLLTEALEITGEAKEGLKKLKSISGVI
ncbi:MAG: hypothetical protein Q9M97_09400 [Candidatus Gracilibacteria bacterium]|nr:hypothetical protein [Candidatus Gracilibacteria bacterium]